MFVFSSPNSGVRGWMLGVQLMALIQHDGFKLLSRPFLSQKKNQKILYLPMICVNYLPTSVSSSIQPYNSCKAQLKLGNILSQYVQYLVGYCSSDPDWEGFTSSSLCMLIKTRLPVASYFFNQFKMWLASYFTQQFEIQQQSGFRVTNIFLYK